MIGTEKMDAAPSGLLTADTRRYVKIANPYFPLLFECRDPTDSRAGSHYESSWLFISCALIKLAREAMELLFVSPRSNRSLDAFQCVPHDASADVSVSSPPPCASAIALNRHWFLPPSVVRHAPRRKLRTRYPGHPRAECSSALSVWPDVPSQRRRLRFFMYDDLNRIVSQSYSGRIHPWSLIAFSH